MNILAPPSPQQSGKTGTSGLATGLDSLGGLMGFLAANQGSKPKASAMMPYGPDPNNPNPFFWYE
jgi:hypothetical protein